MDSRAKAFFLWIASALVRQQDVGGVQLLTLAMAPATCNPLHGQSKTLMLVIRCLPCQEVQHNGGHPLRVHQNTVHKISLVCFRDCVMVFLHFDD